MRKSASRPSAVSRPSAAGRPTKRFPGQIVLVLQGGGALGAYQAGVYHALHEHGLEPDWVIGTSIGAINAALIAGNEGRNRLARLRTFWDRVETPPDRFDPFAWLGMGNLWTNLRTVTQGIPAFFRPNPSSILGPNARVGVEQASYYLTEPLRNTLLELVDFGCMARQAVRLTVGAVHVCSGKMHYFDSRRENLSVDHVMASGALPPAFPAVRIDGETYWDGGIYSNTPIEAVLDDNPRRDSLIFAVNVWQQSDAEPQSIAQVAGRQKDIQYASRADSHIVRQKQIHRLRHVIRELTEEISHARQSDPRVRELASWGCGTTMHVAHLDAPRLDGEDQAKDIDFSAAGVRARWQAGYASTRRMLDAAPWLEPVSTIEGVIEHVLKDPVPA